MSTYEINTLMEKIRNEKNLAFETLKGLNKSETFFRRFKKEKREQIVRIETLNQIMGWLKDDLRKVEMMETLEEIES